MSIEQDLNEKLRKLEALFMGAGTTGEKVAAGFAIDRVKARLKESSRKVADVEMGFSMNNRWSCQLFTALCRRYGMKPYRYKRQRYTTVMLRGPKDFINQTLWPEFERLNEILQSHLSKITDKIVRETIYSDAGEASVVSEPLQLEATG